MGEGGGGAAGEAEEVVSLGEESPVEKHLTRRTSLDELAELWGAPTFTGLPAKRWAIFRSEVEHALASGGELWEWESDGFRSFRGACGVVVVRDGAWIQEWQLGKS